MSPNTCYLCLRSIHFAGGEGWGEGAQEAMRSEPDISDLNANYISLDYRFVDGVILLLI